MRLFAADSQVRDYDEFRRRGIFLGGDLFRVAFHDFIRDPVNHPLGTPSGRVQLFSEAYAATGASPFPKPVILKTTEEYPLRLISPKSRFRVHSQNANIPWFKEHEKHSLWIHPDDATMRVLSDGDEASVTSPDGRLVVSVNVTEDIMRGVVCLQEGIWPELDSDNVDRAGAANVLTSTEPTRPSQASRTHSVIVQVTRASS